MVIAVSQDEIEVALDSLNKDGQFAKIIGDVQEKEKNDLDIQFI
jgi:phosphoribosylaminoimidazole (AIR) synthetase